MKKINQAAVWSVLIGSIVLTAVSPVAFAEATKMTEQNKRVVQGELAPHSLMIETSLIRAIDEVKGLRAGLKVEEDRVPTSTFIQHYKIQGKEINNDLRTAKNHESELNATIQKHPQIAKTDDFRSAQSAIHDAMSLNSSWQAKVESPDYWRNPKAVMDDLDRIEKQLNQALDKTRNFNSSQLNVSNVG